MKYTSTIFAFLLIAALTLFGASITPSPAIAQSSPPSSPMNVSAADGDNPGEVIITWDAVPNAGYYRVGWVNYNDYLEVTGRGRPWSEAFAFVDVANIDQTSHTITRLEPGVLHAFRVASNATEYGQPSFSGWVLLGLAPSPAPQPTPGTPTPGTPTPEEAAIPGRPTASAECYVGQQLTPGQNCWFSVPRENPDPVFAVTDGGPYHGWGQWWFSDGFDFLSTGSHGHLYDIDGADHIFEVTRQDSVWVVEQYGPDAQQPSPGTPTQPTTDGTSFLSISPNSDCQQPVQQLSKGEGCRWDLQHGDVGIFHVVEGGEFDGRLFVRFFGDDHDFVQLYSTGYYQIGDEVSGDLEIERQGSVWILNQVDHVAGHPSPDGSTVLNIPAAPEEDCYVGLQIGPGEGCVVPDPDDPNGYRFHGSVIYGGDYHGRFIRIDDDGDIKLTKPDATMVNTTNYPREGNRGYRFEAKKLAGDVWEIVKVNEQVQR